MEKFKFIFNNGTTATLELDDDFFNRSIDWSKDVINCFHGEEQIMTINLRNVCLIQKEKK